MRPVRAVVDEPAESWRHRSVRGRFAAMRIVLITLALVACNSSDVSRQVGARCDQAAECDERCLGPSLDWPGGFCSITCDTDDDCPSDAACIDESGGGVCAFACLTDPACAFLGEGYVCKERDAHGLAKKVTVCRGE
jgi:hypothetical protein